MIFWYRLPIVQIYDHPSGIGRDQSALHLMLPAGCDHGSLLRSHDRQYE